MAVATPRNARKTWLPDGKPQKRVIGLPVVRILPRCGMTAPLKEREADISAQRDALRLAARQAAAACNAMTLKWLGAHYVGGSSVQLAADPRQVQFSDSSLNLEIYHTARTAAPELLPLNCAATFQWWASSFKTQVSPRDNVKRWRQVLRGLEAAPHYGLTQPIRVAPNACKLNVTEDAMVIECKVLAGGESVRLEVKRPHDETTPTGGNGRKYQDRWRTVANLTKMNGVQLVAVGARWEVRPVVSREARAPLAEEGKTLFLRASTRSAFAARMDGKTVLLFEHAIPLIENARLNLIAVRAEEKAAGRTGARNKNREAATAKWSNTCATLSRQLCSYIVGWCERNGVTTIALRYGDDAALLSHCGLTEEELATEPTRYPYRQFAEFLHQKACLVGIAVIPTPNLRSVKRRKELRGRRLVLDRVRGAAV